MPDKKKKKVPKKKKKGRKKKKKKVSEKKKKKVSETKKKVSETKKKIRKEVSISLKDYAANRRKTCSVSQAKKCFLAFSYVFK